MPIPLSCRCGRSFQAPDQQVGGHAFCPGCGAKHFVPPPDSIVAEPPPPEQPKTQPKPQTKSQSATQSAAKSFRCTVCGGKFNASRVYDDNGEIICHDCYDAEEQGTSQDTGFYIKTWFFPLAWTMFFYTIDLRINDKRHNIGWYQTKFFPLPPGKYTVEMTVHMLFGPMGTQTKRVTVRSDRTPVLEYQHFIWSANLNLRDR